MYEIDMTDRAICDLLMEDGRMSCAEIAHRIGGISERSIRYRMNRLVRQGLIKISAIPNPKTVGYPVVADVFLEVDPGRIMEVARKMAEYECVSYVACSTGDRDISIQVYAHDNQELYRFVAEVVGNVPGVRKTSTVLVPLIIKDVYNWRIPDSACIPAEAGRRRS